MPFFSILGVVALVAFPLLARAVPSERFEFRYVVELAKPSTPFKRLRLWVPLPAEDRAQKVLDRKIISPFSHRETREAKHGNKLLYFEAAADAKLPARIELVYRIERREDGIEKWAGSRKEPSLDPASYLSMDKKVPINGLIARIATEQTKGLEAVDDKLRKLYEHTVESMTYNKDGTGWGQGDAIWACTNRRGNCTDFHSFLIGMARSQGIPARFEIGFPVPPSGKGVVPGYHCWARLHSEAKGWIPVDASESKKSGKTFEYFGKLPPNRIAFTVGRDLVLEPKQDGEPLNYLIYPYLEIDGKPVNDVGKKFFVSSLRGR